MHPNADLHQGVGIRALGSRICAFVKYARAELWMFDPQASRKKLVTSTR